MSLKGSHTHIYTHMYIIQSLCRTTFAWLGLCARNTPSSAKKKHVRVYNAWHNNRDTTLLFLWQMVGTFRALKPTAIKSGDCIFRQRSSRISPVIRQISYLHMVWRDATMSGGCKLMRWLLGGAGKVRAPFG